MVDGVMMWIGTRRAIGMWVTAMFFILYANCCVRMLHFPTEMCPFSCATNTNLYTAIIANPQCTPDKPTIMNHSMSVFAVRRDDR